MFLFLLTLAERQVRDEAHRFAVAYHRKLRGKDMFLPERDATGSAEELDSAASSSELQGFESIPGALSTRALVQPRSASFAACPPSDVA